MNRQSPIRHNVDPTRSVSVKWDGKYSGADAVHKERKAKEQRNKAINELATRIYESFSSYDLDDWLDDWAFDADMDDFFEETAEEMGCRKDRAMIAFGRIAKHVNGEYTSWSP